MYAVVGGVVVVAKGRDWAWDCGGVSLCEEEGGGGGVRAHTGWVGLGLGLMVGRWGWRWGSIGVDSRWVWRL